MDSEILSRYGYPVRAIDVEGLKEGREEDGLGGEAGCRKAWSSRCCLLKETAPDVVVGMGGYSSGPVCLAARLMGIPPRFMSRTRTPVSRTGCSPMWWIGVFISFSESRDYLSARIVELTGNPVRKELVEPGEPGTGPG